MKHLTEHLWFETPHQQDYLTSSLQVGFAEILFALLKLCVSAPLWFNIRAHPCLICG